MIGLAASAAMASARLVAPMASASTSTSVNAAGLDSAQVAQLDATLVKAGVGAAKRHTIENDRSLASKIAVDVRPGPATKPPASAVHSSTPASPASSGVCSQGGPYQVVTWALALYSLNVYHQRMFTETHRMTWCINYPAHNWVTYVATPILEPVVTYLGGLAGWHYDGSRPRRPPPTPGSPATPTRATTFAP